jgi:hypothetical protein
MPRLEETNFIDALVAAGVPRGNIEVVNFHSPPPLNVPLADGGTMIMSFPSQDEFTVDFTDTVPSSLDIPSIKQDEVILRGTSIACVRDSDGETTTIVIFKPTPATRKAALEYEGQAIALHINDENGQFTPRSPQRITGSVYEPGNNTMIVTTENQS